jgi:hypothetical protein
MSRTVFYISLLFIWPSWLVTVAKKKSVKFFIYFWGIGYRMPFKGLAAGRHRRYRVPRWHSRPMDVKNLFFLNLNFNLVSAEGTKGIFFSTWFICSAGHQWPAPKSHDGPIWAHANYTECSLLMTRVTMAPSQKGKKNKRRGKKREIKEKWLKTLKSRSENK